MTTPLNWIWKLYLLMMFRCCNFAQFVYVLMYIWFCILDVFVSRRTTFQPLHGEDGNPSEVDEGSHNYDGDYYNDNDTTIEKAYIPFSFSIVNVIFICGVLVTLTTLLLTVIIVCRRRSSGGNNSSYSSYPDVTLVGEHVMYEVPTNRNSDDQPEMV